MHRCALGRRLAQAQSVQGELSAFHPYNCRNIHFLKARAMAIYQLDADSPDIHPSAWVADDAQVMGRVKLAADSSVWFGAVIRGDTADISVGEGSNIQDGSVLHADVGMPLTIGRHVTVGHQVMLHGCTVGDECLIGIGSVVLNGAKIGDHCLVGARSLVTEGKEFPAGSLIMGSPAKVVRQLTPEQIEGLRQSAQGYVDNAKRFKAGLKKIA
jgi:carbonic anhydrase/acetyltransferase-like protein (isoleucine patch superfamily)